MGIKRSLSATLEEATHYYQSSVIRAQSILGLKTGSPSENYLHTNLELLSSATLALSTHSAIMPSLPFNDTPSASPSASPSLSPSIVLSSPETGSASTTMELHKSKANAAEQYRMNMAKYFAATFNMSMTAALAEADAQLAPRRASSFSEAESFRAI
ncbi:hypothetical protein HBI56_155330 [Parastagonospora nodorum]|nr:hypothetical protein HBH56_118030 [Parastagonospora nodorum]QRD05251.1 hypothetical protein JI435_111530 [Parastagonospora nodorum SN15]KAH3928942.1 hypothetical protein HBH54_131180 [Parastagonospora nodorum]KAH3950556.1 hypothetical protein HBH53_071450 [Parastagonospora nodorum]KAH3959818.1 hypothetical protein HBH51_196440 [Parastagonospora nodorum]